MAERAQVRSIDALETFRAHLVVYLSKVRPLVEEIGSDLRRMQDWLENDQRLCWERELRRRTRLLEQAQGALLSARLSTFREAESAEHAAVRTARAAVNEAEDKLRLIRHWARDFGPRTATLARQVGALDTVLAQDLPKGVAWLAEAIRLLEAYAGVRREPVAPPASVAAEGGAGGRPAAAGREPGTPPAAPLSPS